MDEFYLKDLLNSICNSHYTLADIKGLEVDHTNAMESRKRYNQLYRYMCALTEDCDIADFRMQAKCQEFLDKVKSLDHPYSFENHHVAEKVFKVYTFEGPVFELINTILQDEKFDKYP